MASSDFSRPRYALRLFASVFVLCSPCGGEPVPATLDAAVVAATVAAAHGPDLPAIFAKPFRPLR